MDIRDYNEIELQNIKDSYHVNSILNNRDIEKLIDACDDYQSKQDKIEKALESIECNIFSEDMTRTFFYNLLKSYDDLINKKGHITKNDIKDLKRTFKNQICDMHIYIQDLLKACDDYVDIVTK